jgi:hypothetical protein
MRAAIVAILVATSALAPADEADDTAAVRSFLARAHPHRHWDSGPTRVDSESIRKVWPGLRFFVVRSNRPLPPGAAIQENIERYQQAMQRLEREMLDATVAVNARGAVRELARPHDYDVGRARIRSEADVRLVTAALADLQGSGGVDPSSVTVERQDGGWHTQVITASKLVVMASFDAKGRVMQTGASYIGPMPP